MSEYDGDAISEQEWDSHEIEDVERVEEYSDDEDWDYDN